MTTRLPRSETPPQHRQTFDGSPLSDAGERRAIFKVLDSFRQYRRQTHFNTTHRRRQNFYALSSAHQKLLNGSDLAFLDTLSTIDDAIDENADIADAILDLALETFGLPAKPENSSAMNWHDVARPLDLNKAHSTLRQFWRDWSKEGFEAEVKVMLDLILDDLKSRVSMPANETRVLVPGAGLGRLLFELCLAGYIVEGNEISYHQLLASNFILNCTDRADQYRLYPFITSFNNHLSRHNQLHSVTVPDVHPGTAIAERHAAQQMVGEMNMSAGDFITAYSSEDSAATFDAVTTVYFVDTAPNVIRYMETINHCLAKDGIWINIGPLLWHFEERTVDEAEEQGNAEHTGQQESPDQTGIAEPGSFELTDEEVLVLACKMGFELLSHEILPSSAGGYIQDPHSMLQSRYRCSHWVLRKVGSPRQ